MCIASRVYGMQTCFYMFSLLATSEREKIASSPFLIQYNSTSCSRAHWISFLFLFGLPRIAKFQYYTLQSVGYSLIIKIINLSSMKFINKFSVISSWSWKKFDMHKASGTCLCVCMMCKPRTSVFLMCVFFT